jgi:4-amino-4-deoxy-L-arabinose transferase-like glycosyltransferase
VRLRVVFLIALCGLAFFAGLGRAAITDSDEAFYAEAGREMVESGDYLTPHFGYQPRFQKPILFYWLVAAAYTVAGVNEAAARFWAAMAGLGLVLVTWAAARRWYGDRTATTAAAISATSFGLFAWARLSLPDLPLALFVSLSIWAALVALDEDSAGRRLTWWLVSGLAAALAFLTKGPIGAVLPAIVAGPMSIVEWRRRRRVPFAWSHLALAGLVFVVVAAPWYFEMWRVHGDAYLRSFFVGDNLERFATTRFNDSRPPWFYAPVLLAQLLPWSGFLLLLVAPAINVVRRRRPLAAAEIRLVLWAALPLLLFAVSVGKQPRYVLPVLPPLILLLARAIEVRLAGRIDLPAGPGTLCRIGGGFAGIAIMAVGIALYLLGPLIRHPAPLVLPGAGLTALAGVAVMGVSLSRWWRSMVPAVAAASLVALLSAQYTILSGQTPEPVAEAASIVRANLRPGDRWATYDVFLRNLVFYVQAPERVHPFDDGGVRALLEARERVVLVIPAEDLARVETDSGLRVKRLGEVAYFNTADIKVSRLLSPDPVRDIRKVLIVTNQQD